MKSPIKTDISASSPLFVIMAPHWPAEDHQENKRNVLEHWEQLDDELKPYCTVQIDGHLLDRFRRIEVLLPAAQAAGIPITLQIQSNNGESWNTLPLSTVRRYVDTYSCIVGLQITEASQRTFVVHGLDPEHAMGRNARYLRDAIRLCGEYGLFMSWQEMGENLVAVGCSANNEALFETLYEYGEYVIPTHAMNGAVSKYLGHLGGMGLWLSGATAQWGVEGQSFYWSDCGYNELGHCMGGSMAMPGGIYATMYLLGASAGASVFSVEPGQDFWFKSKDWIEPTFKRILKERLIPSRAEMMATTPVAYHMSLCEKPIDFHKISADLDFDRHEGRLIRGTYGVFDRARDAEMIPNTPRYGWIPVLPAKTPDKVLCQFKRIIRPGEISSVEYAREIANEHFPEVDRGDAWSYLAGPLAVAANTHENWLEPESVKLTVPKRPTNLHLEKNGDVWTLAWDSSEGDQSYHVWRLRDDREECLTDEPVTQTTFPLHETADGDLFAVSAITNAEETIEGTLHIHHFLILSMRESRRSLWVGTNANVEPVERPRFGEAIPEVTPEMLADEVRCAECHPVQDLASPVISSDDADGLIKREMMDTLLGWKQAIEAEDVDRFLSFYADDYVESDGRTSESVGVVFRSIFQKYMGEAIEHLVERWGAVSAAWRSPAVRLFVREWRSVTPDRIEVDCQVNMWAGGGPEMEPSDTFKVRHQTLQMVWTHSADGWKIHRTTPAFLRMENTGIYRFRYQGW
jgi:hypothetical protein